MTWSHLLPLPADPVGLSLDAAIRSATAAIIGRRPGAVQTVRAWPAGTRRLLALRIHLDAVSHDGPPDEDLAAHCRGAADRAGVGGARAFRRVRRRSRFRPVSTRWMAGSDRNDFRP